MARYAEGSNKGERLRHSLDREGLPAFNVYLQKIDSCKIVPLHQIVEREPRYLLAARTVGDYTTLLPTISGLDQHRFRLLSDSAMDRHNVAQTIQLDRGPQALES